MRSRSMKLPTYLPVSGTILAGVAGRTHKRCVEHGKRSREQPSVPICVDREGVDRPWQSVRGNRENHDDFICPGVDVEYGEV